MIKKTIEMGESRYRRSQIIFNIIYFSFSSNSSLIIQ